MFTALITFLNMASCAPLFAVEYHVDRNKPAASDENPGTAEKPFRHIQHAADMVQPGDIMTIHGGTYRETINWKTPGTKDKRITIQSAPGETAVIKGSVLVRGWEKISAKDAGLKGEFPRENIWIKKNWERKNITSEDEADFSQKDKTMVESPRWAFWKDAVLEGAGWMTFAFKREELQEERIFHDAENKALVIWLPPGIDPNKDGIEVCVMPLFFIGDKSHLHIKKLQFRHANTRNYVNWPAISTGTGSIFEDNIVSWCDYIGYAVGGDDAIVRRNIFAFNGASGMGGSGNRHLIEDNKVLYNNVDRHDTYNDAGGGKWVALKNSIIRRHEAAYNYGPGFWLDIDNTGNVFESCIFHHNHGAGLFIEISPDNIVKNCIFAFNTERPAGMNVKWEPHGKSPTQARSRYYSSSAGGGWGAYNSSSQGTKWFNNLFYANQNAGLVCEGTWRGDGSAWPYDEEGYKKSEKGWTTTRNIAVKNNIFAGNGGPQLVVRSIEKDPDCVNNISDYNLFDMPCGGGASIGATGSFGPYYKTLDDWRKATGFDEHSISAGSELTFPAAGDYRPTLISPAADAGTAIGEVLTDYFGIARPVGRAYDIGPYERYSILSFGAVAMPSGLTFKTIDIKPLLNRALADEKGDDGIGGWSDQGPACDLRGLTGILPTDAEGHTVAADVKLAGVLFRIEYPRSILVLNPKHFRPGNLPEKTAMPVGEHAAWLFFLHSTAWAGEWDYVVNYDDGTRETINVRCPGNIRDWSTGEMTPIKSEDKTLNAPAWQGNTDCFPRINIFRMAWENPQPEKKIKNIEMNGLTGVPGLFSITLGKK